MNVAQKAVIMLGIVVILLLGLYPPWVHVFSLDKGKSQQERASIYGLIFKPPEEPSGPMRQKFLVDSYKDDTDRFRQEYSRFSENYRWGVLLDTPRLLAQWAMVIITVTGLCLVLKKS